MLPERHKYWVNNLIKSFKSYDTRTRVGVLIHGVRSLRTVASRQKLMSTTTITVPTQPPPLKPDADGASCRKWRTMFEAYARAKLQDQNPDDRIAALVICIGFEALEVYEALPFADAYERKSLETSLKLFEEHFLGKQNVIYERWSFKTRKQEFRRKKERRFGTTLQSCGDWLVDARSTASLRNK